MSDPTQSYFDYRTTCRVIFGLIVGVAMLLSTCAYGWGFTERKEQAAIEEKRQHELDMFDHGYIEVPKPCTPTGELMWQKKD